MSTADDAAARHTQRQERERLDAETRRFWKAVRQAAPFLFAFVLGRYLLGALATSLHNFDPSEHRVAVIVIGMVATAAIIALVLRDSARDDSTAEETRHVLARGGGWLTVFQVNVAILVVAYVGGAIREISLRTDWSLRFVMVLLVTLLPALVALYGFLLIVKRRPFAKPFWKTVLAASLIVFTVASLSRAISVSDRGGLLDMVALLAVWLIYWQKSFRVRVTFAQQNVSAPERRHLVERAVTRHKQEVPATAGTAAARPSGRAAGDGAPARGLVRWVALNPLYAGLALILACGFAWFSPAVWNVTYRAGLAVWPPSPTGSWANLEREALEPAFTLTLAEHAGRVSGVGTLNGAPLTLDGVASGRTADLMVVFGNARFGATSTMPDRSTLLLTLKDRGGDGRTFRLERR